MRFQVLFFLLLLTCMYLSLAQGSYGNCCLRYSRGSHKVRMGMIQEYRMQETDGDCNIKAVVLTLKQRSTGKSPRTICADPDHPNIQKLVGKMRTMNMLRV